jgi:hypothetical protein
MSSSVGVGAPISEAKHAEWFRLMDPPPADPGVNPDCSALVHPEVQEIVRQLKLLAARNVRLELKVHVLGESEQALGNSYHQGRWQVKARYPEFNALNGTYDTVWDIKRRIHFLGLAYNTGGGYYGFDEKRKQFILRCPRCLHYGRQLVLLNPDVVKKANGLNRDDSFGICQNCDFELDRAVYQNKQQFATWHLAIYHDSNRIYSTGSGGSLSAIFPVADLVPLS